MNTEKVTQLVIKLIKLTKTNVIKWTSTSPQNAELPNEEIILDKIYWVTAANKDFQLYKYKFKYYPDEYEFEWIKRYRLELIDKGGNTDYEFEYENSMKDLYNIVRAQVSGADEIIDEILAL